MESLLQDVHYVLKNFRKSPLFVAIVVLTLMMGIGANTAIFSLVNAVLMKSLPVQNPGQLVVVGDPGLIHMRFGETEPRADIFSYPLYRELRDQNTTFSGMLATAEIWRIRVVRKVEGSEGGVVTDQAIGALVSGNYFSVLGVHAFMGRTFTDADDNAAGAHPVVVLRYGFWKEKLGGDPAIVGKTLLLNSYPYSVTGVAPPEFFGDTVGDQQDIWFPVTMQEQVFRGRTWLNNYRSSWVHLIGRLKPGSTAGQARAELNVIFRQLAAGSLGDATHRNDRSSLSRLMIELSDGSKGFSEVRGNYRDALWILMVIVALVLLIACVNIANLLLVRTLNRRSEIALRLALGATRWRIFRQLVTESLLLSFTGGVMGLLVAHWGTKLLLQIARETSTEAHLDLRVLAFTGILCLITGIFFGLVPALRSVETGISHALKTRREEADVCRKALFRWGWGKILVGAQVAVALLVLFAAGLLIRTMRNLRDVDLGFDRESVLLVRVDPISAGYNTPHLRADFASRVASELAALPGVRAATYSENGLFFGNDNSATVSVDGFIPRTNSDLDLATDRVGPNYFSILRVPMVLGREIRLQDAETSTRVAVLNQSASQFYFGDQDPVGKTLQINDKEKPLVLQIVGVVGNVHDEDVKGNVPRRFYVPMSQSPDTSGATFFILRTAQNPDMLADVVRKTINGLDNNLPITGVRSLSEMIDASLRTEIVISRLSTFFGAFALVLAALGLYAVMSYIVAGKTRTIGIRMAIGAQRQDVLWLILKEALLLVVTGVIIGIPLAFMSSRLLASLLFGLKATDPISMLLVVLLLGLIALLASYIPARRATKVDPLVAIKGE